QRRGSLSRWESIPSRRSDLYRSDGELYRDGRASHRDSRTSIATTGASCRPAGDPEADEPPRNQHDGSGFPPFSLPGSRRRRRLRGEPSAILQRLQSAPGEGLQGPSQSHLLVLPILKAVSAPQVWGREKGREVGEGRRRRRRRRRRGRGHPLTPPPSRSSPAPFPVSLLCLSGGGAAANGTTPLGAEGRGQAMRGRGRTTTRKKKYDYLGAWLVGRGRDFRSGGVVTGSGGGGGGGGGGRGGGGEIKAPGGNRKCRVSLHVGGLRPISVGLDP
ncbi:maintenance of mitochondrial morphology protein 1-like, partial [Phasianus colchicus]|uniref:maintenance of mitochondrial morphology protein 1-like n=1 Tax=Phasianus colchicus TaxID=9054 RepID=UPI00129D2366